MLCCPLDNHYLKQVVSDDVVPSNDVAVNQGGDIDTEGRDVNEDDDDQASFRYQNGDGFFCMDKVMTIQEILYDEEVSNFKPAHTGA